MYKLNASGGQDSVAVDIICRNRCPCWEIQTEAPPDEFINRVASAACQPSVAETDRAERWWWKPWKCVGTHPLLWHFRHNLAALCWFKGLVLASVHMESTIPLLNHSTHPFYCRSAVSAPPVGACSVELQLFITEILIKKQTFLPSVLKNVRFPAMQRGWQVCNVSRTKV